MNRFTTAGLGLALAATPLVATAGTATANDATAQRAAAPAYSVSAAISRTTAIAKEDVVKIRGKVSPKAAGDKVVLQQRMEGKKTWSVSGTVKIKDNGKFLLKDKPSTAGTRYYRVLKPAAGTVKKGVSQELKLVVYAWEKLSYRTSGPESNVSFTTATIGTEPFSASLVTEEAGLNSSIEYTLGKKCLKLRATYALTDSSATGGTGSVALAKDGKNVFSYGLVLGQIVENNEVDISDAFRITYSTTSTKAPDSFVAVASPEVLCTK